jgi:hypothetical protein
MLHNERLPQASFGANPQGCEDFALRYRSGYRFKLKKDETV